MLDIWYARSKRELVRLWQLLGRNKYVNKRKLISFSHASFGTKPSSAIDLSIGIVVPCYRHARFLPTALHSVKSQTVAPDEVVLVDDHSPDETGEICRDFIRRNSQLAVKLVTNQKNLGQSLSLNRGIEASKSSLVMILNDDDYLMHDAIERVVQIFREESDIALLGSKAIFVYSEAHFRNLKKQSQDYMIDSKYVVRKSLPSKVPQYKTGKEIDMTHSGMTFRRSAWESVGGYLPNKSERVIIYSDRDFQLRVNSLYPVGIVENAAFSFWRMTTSVDGGLYS